MFRQTYPSHVLTIVPFIMMTTDQGLFKKNLLICWGSSPHRATTASPRARANRFLFSFRGWTVIAPLRLLAKHALNVVCTRAKLAGNLEEANFAPYRRSAPGYSPCLTPTSTAFCA